MKHRAKVLSVWELCILIQTLIVLCGVVRAQQPAMRSAFDRVVQTVEQGGLASLDPTMITALGRNVAGTSNDSIAAAVESGELQAEVTAGGKVPLNFKGLPPQIRAAGLAIAGEMQLVGGETGGASISMHDLFELKINKNLKDRSLGVTYVLKTPESGVVLRRVPLQWRKFLKQNGGEVQIVTEYKFKTETDLIAATGADLNVVPFFPTTKKLTENLVRLMQGKTSEPLLDSASSPSEMIAGMMPEMFKAAGRCESMKAGFAVKMSTPGGAVTVRKMTQYGAEAGEPVAKPYVDIIVSKGVKTGAKGVEGKLEGALSYSTLERPPQPEAKTIANAIRKSGLGGIVEAAPATMLPFKAIRGKLGEVAVAVDRKVGGVLIRFDAATWDEATETDVGRFNGQLRALLEGENQGFVVRFGKRKQEFVKLSLTEWEKSGQRTLGDLTRVRGYILEDNDIVLVGQVEPGRPRIEAELLTVALNAIYLEGSWPFVSIDPDPFNPFGSQKPRIGGVPDRFSQSEFVRIMLDSDYDMKRINLGELRLDIPGFRSSYDIIGDLGEAVQPEMRRFWLAPSIAASADVLVNGQVLVFESGVRVLTERMKRVGEFMVSSMASDGHGEWAADLLTHYYGEIEKRVDSFYQLHGLFDVAKLCAILRHRNVEQPVLHSIATRPVREVRRQDGRKMLEPFDGIGPKLVPGTVLMVGGGASSQQRIRKSSFVNSAVLAGLREGQTTLELEASIPLPAASHPDLLYGSAVQELSAGDISGCISSCTQALDIDPEYAEVRVIRALALLEAGRAKEALADLDTAAKTYPRIIGLRGVARFRIGDVEGAKADVEAAAAQFPDDEAVWLWNGSVKTFAMELDGAKKAVDRLLEINPASPDAEGLLSLMLWMQRLDKDYAREWSHAILNLPFAIMEALTEGQAAIERMDFGVAVASFRHAMRLAEEKQDNEAVRSFHLIERCLMSLAYAEATEARFTSMLQSAFERREVSRHPEKASTPAIPGVGHADRLIAIHPDWPSGYFAKAICALVQPKPVEGFQPNTYIDEGLKRAGNHDPLWKDWQIVLGESNPGRAMNAMGLQLTLTALRSAGKDARNPAAMLKGKLPTPYVRALAAEPGMTGRMAKTMLPFFELMEMAVTAVGLEERQEGSTSRQEDLMTADAPKEQSTAPNNWRGEAPPGEAPVAEAAEEQPPAEEALPQDVPPEEVPPHRRRPEPASQKRLLIEFAQRIIGQERSEEIVRKITEARSIRELEKPLAKEFLRVLLPGKYGKALAARIDKAESLETAMNDEEAIELLAQGFRDILHRVYEETRDEAPEDMAASAVFSLYMLVYTVTETLLGDPDQALELAHAHLSRLPVRAGTLEGNGLLGQLRFQATLVLAGVYAFTSYRDLFPGLPPMLDSKKQPKLRDQFAAGKIEPEEFVAKVRLRDRHFLTQLRQKNSAFTYELLHTVFGPLEASGGIAGLAMSRSARLIDENPDLAPAHKQRILAGIQAESERIKLELLADLAGTLIRPNESFSAQDKDQLLAAFKRGEQLPDLAIRAFEKLINGSDIEAEQKAELLKMVREGRGLHGPLDEKAKEALIPVFRSAIQLFDPYAIWDPAVRAAEAPAELETIKPLLMVLDLVTNMVPGLMSQMPIPESPSSRDSGSGTAMPNIMSWFMNAWTASKARTYEQVRLKTIRFQLEELDRVSQQSPAGR